MASYEQRGDSVRAIVRLPGGRKKSATFDTMAQAERWGSEMEAKKKLGTLTGPGVRGLRVSHVFEAYLDSVAEKTDSGKWNRLRLTKWLDDPLSSIRLGDATTHDINEWIDRSLSTPSKRTGKLISASTVNRELNLMSAAFTYAVKVRRWIEINPCHGCHRPERGRPRKRPLLTAAELKAIRIATGYETDPQLLTLTARVGAAFLLSLETGMRSGEILRIRPGDYWRERRTVYVSATERGGRKAARSGRASTDPSRQVPLTERAIELLDQLSLSIPEKQKAKAGFSKPPYIVGVDDGQRDALWRKARDRSGVEDLHYHDTKHEAATRMANFLNPMALSYAIGTKDVRLLRDTYYSSDASEAAALLPRTLSTIG